MTLDEVILIAAETATTYVGPLMRHLLDEARQSARIMAWKAWQKKPTIQAAELRRVAYTGVVKAIREGAPRPPLPVRPPERRAGDAEYHEALSRVRIRRGPRAAFVVDLVARGHTRKSAAERAKCHPSTVTRILKGAQSACA